MNRIEETLTRLNRENKTALVPYFMAAYPDKETFHEIVRGTIKAGADLVEVGLPFSDPIADGPAIQKAGHKVQKMGFSGVDYFSLIKKLRSEFPETPFICMTYYNLLLKNGLGRFVKVAVDSGLDGIIVPDLPVEEASPLIESCQKEGLDLIMLVSPTSNNQRIKKISEISSGFIYCVTLTGVTGARKELPEDVHNLLIKVKKSCKLPVFAGFGISTPSQIESLKKMADGIIIGSAILDVIDKAPADRRIRNVITFIKEIKKVLE